MIADRARSLFAPLAWLYGAGVGLRNAGYAGGRLRVVDVGVRVVSIGNLTTGGTGKSPLVRLVAGKLLAEGQRPGILLRGYRARGALEPVPPWREAPPPGALDRFGDEALEHVRAMPGAIVVAHPDRVRAARVAIDAGARVLVLDDAFQHRRMHRDLDVVCLDAAAPFGRSGARGALLPAGDLREPIASLGRADLIAWTRARADVPGERALARVREVAPSVPALRLAHRPGRRRLAGAEEAGTAERVVLVAGVADPASPRASAAEAGIAVVDEVSIGDHAPLGERRTERLLAWARSRGADAVLVTAKDEPRLLAHESGRRHARAGRIEVLELALEIVEGGETLERELERLVALTEGA